ncbi:hypothetical protein [Metabacillus fastidiosus]
MYLPGDTAPSLHYWAEDIITPEVEVKTAIFIYQKVSESAMNLI